MLFSGMQLIEIIWNYSKAKTSRDSGLSSGDPSPNASQSHGSGPSPTGTLLLEHLLTARLEGPTSRQYIYRSQSSDSSLLSVHNPKRMDSRCSKFIHFMPQQKIKILYQNKRL